MTDEPTTVRVPVLPMTEANFHPYGELFGREEIAAQRGFSPTGFSHDGRVTLTCITQPPGPRSFSRLERHFGVTQAFVQLSGAPAVVCVAAATGEDAAAVPDPHDVLAFAIDPEVGYLFHVGTWHSLDRYLPAGDQGARFLIVNVVPNPTQIVDYASGESWMHADLDALPPQEQPSIAWSGFRFEV